jgi:hypothetical protein
LMTRPDHLLDQPRIARFAACIVAVHDGQPVYPKGQLLACQQRIHVGDGLNSDQACAPPRFGGTRKISNHQGSTRRLLPPVGELAREHLEVRTVQRLPGGKLSENRALPCGPGRSPVGDLLLQ